MMTSNLWEERQKAPGRAIRTTGQMRADGRMAHPSFG